MISVGNTFLVPSGETGNYHLFFVILGPVDIEYSPKQQFLLVNATTIREGVPYDDSCVLRAGDHPFIVHDSYINYRYARIEPEADIVKKLNTVFIPKEDCTPELLHRIIEGVKASRHLRRDLKALFA